MGGEQNSGGACKEQTNRSDCEKRNGQKVFFTSLKLIALSMWEIILALSIFINKMWDCPSEVFSDENCGMLEFVDWLPCWLGN